MAGSNTLAVDLSGLKLPAAALDRIERAVQKAVMLEIAAIDFAPPLHVEMTRPKGPKIPELGATRGIIIREPVKKEG
jgi:hypothetical protein